MQLLLDGRTSAPLFTPSWYLGSLRSSTSSRRQRERSFRRTPASTASDRNQLGWNVFSGLCSESGHVEGTWIKCGSLWTRPSLHRRLRTPRCSVLFLTTFRSDWREWRTVAKSLGFH